MTPEQYAEDILKRCWWREEQNPGMARPSFSGLDVEIADVIKVYGSALRAAIADHLEYCATVAEGTAVITPNGLRHIASKIRSGEIT